MRKERKHFTPEEKVAILRQHLVDRAPVSELCEELGLRPTVFYRWQKELFENGAAAFQSQERKRLTNTPVRQAGSVLKCPDDRKNRVVSAQATYTSGSSAVGG